MLCGPMAMAAPRASSTYSRKVKASIKSAVSELQFCRVEEPEPQGSRTRLRKRSLRAVGPGRQRHACPAVHMAVAPRASSAQSDERMLEPNRVEEHEVKCRSAEVQAHLAP